MKLDGIRNIYLLGDLHFGVYSNSIEWFRHQREFLIDWFISEIKKDGFDPELDILFQAGDWNHVRESTNVRISNESLEIFDEISKVFKSGIHIILGNHDVYYKDRTDVHSLKEVNRIYDNIKVYEEPEAITINGSHKILMLPWDHDSSSLSSKVKLNSDADYILCHADIKDFKLNSKQKLESGLSRSELSDFKRIWSGHIHIRQDYKNINYIGTPYEIDRGDHGNLKGFYKLNVEGSEIIETFYPNTFSSRFIRHNVVDILNMTVNEISEIFNNNFVDLYIDHDFAKIFPLTGFIELIKDCGHRNLEFNPIPSDKSGDKIVVDGGYDYSMFDILEEYLKIRKFPENISKSVDSKFKELYNEIKNNKKGYE